MSEPHGLANNASASIGIGPWLKDGKTHWVIRTKSHRVIPEPETLWTDLGVLLIQTWFDLCTTLK